MTIHKAQGSEFSVVIIPITLEHKRMLQRNLMYTAVTRAKKLLIMIGDAEAVNYAVENDVVIQRRTGLSEKIRELLKTPR